MVGKSSGSKKDGASKGSGAKGDRGAGGRGAGGMGGRGDAFDRMFGARRQTAMGRSTKKPSPFR
jgi:hypothetical protein